MAYPNFKQEKKLWKKGYKKVAGLDEAGRGPLAGPVVAAAVIIKRNKTLPSGVKDSKKMNSGQREKLSRLLKSHPAVQWGIGTVSEKIIDKINILEATKLAMKKALRDMERRGVSADFLILDGKMELSLKTPQQSIIKADEKIFSCSAASILAKVERDGLMERYHKKYPAYGFNRHKGYGTKRHLKMLKKHGVSAIHRKSFQPVKACLVR